MCCNALGSSANVICHGQLTDKWTLVICQHCLTFHPNLAFLTMWTNFHWSQVLETKLHQSVLVTLLRLDRAYASVLCSLIANQKTMCAGYFSWFHLRMRWGAKKKSTKARPPEVSTDLYCTSPLTHRCVQKLPQNPPTVVPATKSPKNEVIEPKSDEVGWLVHVLQSF